MGESSCSRTAEISTIESDTWDCWVADSVSNGWTDEKHSLFLDSIESSFVDQLYNNQYHTHDASKLLLGSKKRTYSCISHANESKPDQFKVISRGCWESVRFERAKTQDDSKNDCHPMLSSPWIQRFRSPSIDKEECGTAYGVLAENEFANSSHLVASQKNYGKETKLKNLPCLPYIYCQDLMDSKIEMSDQNFVDDEIVVGQQSSRVSKGSSCMNTRSDVLCGVADRVVPSGENSGWPEKSNAECSGITSEISGVPRQANSELSLFRDQG